MDTNQRAFDVVYHHLLAQGQKSVDDYDDCLYRGPDGLRCAVGVLIDDEYYDAELEHIEADDGRVMSAVEASGYPDVDSLLLHRLQIVHDEYDPDRWREKLAKVAEQQGLRVPEDV